MIATLQIANRLRMRWVTSAAQTCPLSKLLYRDYSQSRTHAQQFPPRRKINEDEIEESFLKGSGPGGQKINKTNSAVQLKHIPTGIVVKCQDTRSRSQNRTIARQNLGQRLEDLEKGDQSRTAIKAAIRQKKTASADKKKRRKYRRLEAAREDASADKRNDGELDTKKGIRSNEIREGDDAVR